MLQTSMKVPILPVFMLVGGVVFWTVLGAPSMKFHKGCIQCNRIPIAELGKNIMYRALI